MKDSSFRARLIRLFAQPRYVISRILICTSSLWNDRLFIRVMFWCRTGQKLNLKKPTTFTEKQNWLKLYDRNPLYTMLVDKYRVKKYVAELIGEQYVVPCYGYWERVEDVDFDSLPNQFVIKCTHNSGGGMCICKDKSKLNIDVVKQGLQSGLQDDFFKYSRVWPYKNVQRGILADKFLDDPTGTELRDYKWWCFNGEPKVMYCTNKGRDIYENFFDMDFNPLDISHGFRRFSPEMEKPAEFELMKSLAKKLSNGIPFVRVDFFDIEGHVYFGEFTFYDWGGMKTLSDKWEMRLGSMITLPSLNKA